MLFGKYNDIQAVYTNTDDIQNC